MKKITLFNYILSSILFLGLIPSVHAQLQNSNWYFGNQAGLNFNDITQPPIILTNSSMGTDGSSASVSDSSGNLLFYTNGIVVWNNAHQIMPNGAGLLGNTEMSQSVLIVPKPDDANKYYIFSNGGNAMGFSGLHYSVLDMALDNGQGDIDVNEKNVLLLENTNERLTAMLNPNDNSYWLVSFAPSDNPIVSDTFYSFKIDPTGVNLASQSTFTFRLPPSLTQLGGQMKISPDGQFLAMTHNTVSTDSRFGILEAESLYSFNFDSTTGVVSSLNSSLLLDEADVLYSYGLEFSPDNNLLYVTTTHKRTIGPPYPDVEVATGRIYQIDYKDLNMGSTPTLIYEGVDPIYSLQLGIDGKIYAVNSSGAIGTIHTPNIFGLGANYVHENIDLSPNSAVKELPQLVPDVIVSAVTPKNYLPKKPVIQGNPFKDELKFKFKFIQTYTIEVYNSAGVLTKTVVYDDMTNRKIYKVDTSGLPQDTYYLIIRDEHSQIWYETVLKVE